MFLSLSLSLSLARSLTLSCSLAHSFSLTCSLALSLSLARSLSFSLSPSLCIHLSDLYFKEITRTTNAPFSAQKNSRAKKGCFLCPGGSCIPLTTESLYSRVRLYERVSFAVRIVRVCICLSVRPWTLPDHGPPPIPLKSRIVLCVCVSVHRSAPRPWTDYTRGFDAYTLLFVCSKGGREMYVNALKQLIGVPIEPITAPVVEADESDHASKPQTQTLK